MTEPRDINQFINNASIVVVVGDYGIVEFRNKMTKLRIKDS